VEKMIWAEPEITELGWITLETDLSVADRIQRCKFKYVNSNYKRKQYQYRLQRAVRRRIVLYDTLLLDPHATIKTKVMRDRILENGDRPAGLDDALEIAFSFPYPKRPGSIVFLDNIAHYDVSFFGVIRDPACPRLVPAGLLLNHLSLLWNARSKFAAVREEEYLDLDNRPARGLIQ
jgi:hypothetical protein